MRKAKRVYVSRGSLTADGATKSEAKANLESMIDAACGMESPIVEFWHGMVVIVAPSATGYYTAVINPAETAEHGKRRYCWTSHALGETFESALASTRMHAAHNAWHADIVDDAAFVAKSGLGAKASDLASWIRFQRGYIAAKQAGMNDSDAFDAARHFPITNIGDSNHAEAQRDTIARLKQSAGMV